MRVNEVRPSKVISEVKNEVSKTYKVGRKFNEAFEKELDKVYKERLSEILSEIDEAADKLKENLNLKDLLRYKKLVKKFLQEATSNMLKYTKKEHVDLRGRKKIYSLVEKVDEELEKLTEEFLKESKKIELLKMIDDIRGLLVDIYS
ncbi:MAG: YaaR family protein [Caldanaerobacter sp.]